mmetsp:Transcript_50385/g.133840  ORF Transcript_50385/g.133840 Transcript_50385/m.133840 type:complete len:1271 (-) Transcript_50385:612-4424(-)
MPLTDITFHHSPVCVGAHDICGAAVGREGPATEQASKRRPVASTRQMFILSSCFERLVLLVGSIGSCINGVGQPVIIVFFGAMVDTLGDTSLDMDVVVDLCYKIGLVGLAQLVGGALQMGCVTWFGERQAKKMRTQYFEAVMAQDISWFDLHDTSSLPQQIDEDIEKYSEAFGDQFGNMMFALAGTSAGWIAALVIGWRIAVVVAAGIPPLFVSLYFVVQSVQEQALESQVWYGQAAATVEECLGAIRTVVSFGNEWDELDRYTLAVEQARKGGVRHSLKMGLSFGWINAVIIWTYALAFWYGAKLKYDGVNNPSTGSPWTAGDILATFFEILVGSFFLGQIFPEMATCSVARVRLGSFVSVVTHHGVIQKPGRVLESVDSLELKNVHFCYPTRPHIEVLRGLNVTIEKGSRMALVGASGSGKSTVLGLLERFYDPTHGQVLVNGLDVRIFDVQSLRKHIGYVGQEPVLFATTIMSNILQGSPEANHEEVRRAITHAQLTFVEELPESFNTFVGEGGCQLSGGQKQRVAIARALVKGPSVLLLDEATSALDNTSEKMIQSTIDHLSSTLQSRMTIVSIAHRLSTIHTCDIVVVGDGVVVEQGRHADLMAQRGPYWALVAKQATDTADETELCTEGESDPVRVDVTSCVPPAIAEAKDVRATLVEDFAPSSKPVDMPVLVQAPSEQGNKVPLRRLVLYCKKEWIFFAPSILGTLVAGACSPVLSVIVVEAMTPFFLEDRERLRSESQVASIQFLLLGFINLFASTTASFSNGILLEAMVKRLRIALITSVFRQDMGFHDNPANTPTLIGRTLELDTLRVAVLGKTAAAVAMALSSVLTGLVISFYYCWPMTLVMLCGLPILVIANMIATSISVGSLKAEGPALILAQQVLSDAVQNPRTVQSNNSAGVLIDRHRSLVERALSETRLFWKSVNAGVGYGITSGSPSFVVGAAFLVAGILIQNDRVEFAAAMKSFMGIFYASYGAGQAALGMGDFGKGKAAAQNLFELLDQPSMIDGLELTGETPMDDLNPAEIEFRGVQFSYPFRDNVQVLDGVSFRVFAGQSVGLVGRTGGGKSTVVALLQRFYDPVQGDVLIGSGPRRPLRHVNIRWWREQVGFVGQEPVLFNASVRDNVTYGSKEVSDARLEDCKAMAHLNFINADKGWEAHVGARGSNLSGGQKQRVAICRAMLRDPKVLLLDEATSALDTESERVVQKALGNLMQGRTSFAVAHRLATIENSDVIMVVDRHIVECGTHDELVSLKGMYYTLRQEVSE